LQARESLDGLEAGWRIMGHWGVTVDLTERGHVIVDLTERGHVIVDLTERGHVIVDLKYLVPGMELVTRFYWKEN
jgi:hypothetical protein